MTIDHSLLSILACPQDKGPLYFVEPEDLLYNPRLKRGYRVVDGIPVMLIEESVALDDTECARLDSLIQSAGIKPTFNR